MNYPNWFRLKTIIIYHAEVARENFKYLKVSESTQVRYRYLRLVSQTDIKKYRSIEMGIIVRYWRVSIHEFGIKTKYQKVSINEKSIDTNTSSRPLGPVVKNHEIWIVKLTWMRMANWEIGFCIVNLRTSWFWNASLF